MVFRDVPCLVCPRPRFRWLVRANVYIGWISCLLSRNILGSFLNSYCSSTRYQHQTLLLYSYFTIFAYLIARNC